MLRKNKLRKKRKTEALEAENGILAIIIRNKIAEGNNNKI